jgi:hypothetical protein
MFSSLSFLGSIVTLVALTIVTWVWLSGKDQPPTVAAEAEPARVYFGQGPVCFRGFP